MDSKLLIGFIGASIIGSISYNVAKKRGHSPYLWFSIGFLMGVLGLIALFIIPRKIPKETPPLPLLPSLDPIPLYYYLNGDRETIGPISHTALTEAFQSEQISHSTYIWNEHLTDWKKIDDFSPLNT